MISETVVTMKPQTKSKQTSCQKWHAQILSPVIFSIIFVIKAGRGG